VAVQNANRSTYQKMTNDLLHGVYSPEFLASHTLAGGNDNKKILPKQVVALVTGRRN